jgi:DNA polymerase III delta prime subunit
MNILEQYKPTNLEGIIGQDFIIDYLRKTIETNYYNNYIFYGLPGCGKTSTSFLYVKELYGENYKKHIFEINASNFRGIKIFKNEIYDFICNDNKINKTIILDEADNITVDAQDYLFNLIEKAYDLNQKINFIIICNYINKINLRIINKCILFRFKLVSNILLDQKINYILKKENKKISKNNINIIIKKSKNDFRKCLNNLESLFMNNNIIVYNNKIDNIMIILLSNNKITEKYNLITKIIEKNKINLINLIEKITKEFIIINKKKNIYSKIEFCHILINLYKFQKSLYSDYNLKIQIYFLLIIF